MSRLNNNFMDVLSLRERQHIMGQEIMRATMNTFYDGGGLNPNQIIQVLDAVKQRYVGMNSYLDVLEKERK